MSDQKGGYAARSGCLMNMYPELPEPVQSETFVLQADEVLITAGGFEPRRLASAHALINAGGARAIVCKYLPEDPRNDEGAILDALLSKGIQVPVEDRLTFDRFYPHSFPDILENSLKRMAVRGVVVDISAMSKLLLILVLDVSWELGLTVRVFYAEAREYAPDEQRFEQSKACLEMLRPSALVYTGFHGLLRHARLSSVGMQGQPTAAIAFMSFNEQLTQAFLNEVSPSRLFLINGRPPRLAWRERATAWIHEQLRVEWPERDNPISSDGLPVRSVCTLNYRETVCCIGNLYWALCQTHRIILAPTGSKMQAVGAYVVKRLHPDIHVEYPTPGGFLDSYSDGIGVKWMLNFGKLADLVSQLRLADRARMLMI